MPYYHIYAEWEDKVGSRFAMNANFSEEKVKKISDRIERGLPFLLKNLKVSPHGITKLEIWKTANIAIMSKKWDWIRATGQIVTNDFVTSIPVHKKRENRKVSDISSEETGKIYSKNIFIVHGRDHKPMKELKTMLLEFGLNPIVLHEQPSGSRTIIEKLEKYSDVGYAFIILTPEDIGISLSDTFRGTLKSNYNKALDSATYLKNNMQWMQEAPVDVALAFLRLLIPRARQNVVLEFGFFIGLLGRDRVCCLYKGDVELPSDMQGIVYVPFKNSVEEKRSMIIKELEAAGYEIKS